MSFTCLKQAYQNTHDISVTEIVGGSILFIFNFLKKLLQLYLLCVKVLIVTNRNKCSVTHLTKVPFPLKTLQNILNLKQKQKNEADYSPGFWIIEV